ncbi:MAG TPA: Ig-like domain-containing protein [Candidatus Microbacterium stercoravium]|uniref:Ig-like domain-containing protein n=1 Tax=Candidatus Microbacterium stercoravium TaxID=2838697 RepID=A0A9D2H4B1_9MICO|nr:Ig-like domain-containing protein [Candidatus Microbacterium stercoravium]
MGNTTRTRSLTRRLGPWLVAALAAGALTAAPAAANAADEAVDVALASGANAPTVDVSYVTGWNSAAALNDGDAEATDDYTKMWGTWGDPDDPEQDWASYVWDEPVTIDSSSLTLWQNHLTGDSGVMLPTAWNLEYRDDAGEWAPVTGEDLTYPLPELDEENPTSSMPAVTASFDEVTTTGVRLTLDRAVVDDERKATSVIAWQVWGEHVPAPEPEPEDPDAFLIAEDVAVRTTLGEAPSLPERVWTIPENGPLAYTDVVWDSIDPADYAEEGAFEVSGAPDGFDSQSVTAEVHVAEALSDTIEAVAYSSTITTPGIAPVLPDTVSATYDDGTRSSVVDVEWEDIDAADYATADAVFDVAGTVAEFAAGAVATVFVVEPSELAAPIVSIELDSAPQGSGWYTSVPTVTVSADETASPVASIEYSLDGENWSAYTEPFPVDAQGEVTVSARATSEEGETGSAQTTVKVDTLVPETTVDVEPAEDGTSATVTLTASDSDSGSGVTRTVWSDGPNPSPTGEENNMFATYDEPFMVELTDEPRYVHVRSEDAAGNIEEYVTVELPRRGGESPEPLDVTTSARCVAGSTALVVSVQNTGDAAVDAEISTPYGDKTVQGLQPGQKTSNAFSTRGADMPAGEVTVSGEKVPFEAHACG